MATRKTLPTILTLCLSLCVASINATPMDMPPREDGSVLVGDIAYSAEEWESLLAKNLQSLKILWPKTNGVVNIPYKISNPEVNTALMEQAFSAWESKTCVKFSKMAESDKRLEYLDFMIKGYCYSYLGYRKGITTPVSLPSSCTFKVFRHELGHSLGLQHEMNRSDRDKHIFVIPGVKYRPGFSVSFKYMDTINFDTPYDYCSIMHYQDTAGSENDDVRTMLALDARFQTLMGWCSTNITHWNYKLVNTMYNCTDDWLKACKQESDPCKNGGYTQKDCSCACPLGTSGDKCENLDMNYNDAMVQQFTPYTAIIKTSGAEVVSPGYPKPKGLGKLSYTQLMQAPKCHKAVVTFSDFQLDPRRTDDKKNCKDGSLEIRTDVSVVNGKIFCGEEIKNGTVFKSDQSELIFHFYDGNLKHKGYKAMFTTEAIPNCR